MRSDARSSSPEAQLLRHVRQIGEVRLAQRALLFHLSRLQKHHRRDKHLRIAANMLEELVNRFNGRLFLLQEGDLVVTCKGARQKTLEEAVEVIRYLFNDDPLARAETAPPTGTPIFAHDDHFEVYSSSASRKLTTGAGTLLTPPSKMRRGVMPAPYTAVLAS